MSVGGTGAMVSVLVVLACVLLERIATQRQAPPPPLSVLDRLLALFAPPLPEAEGAPADTTAFAKEYDFVVVGAGSGGSVVANRLTEVAAWSVLLLEAGGDEIFLTDVPLTTALMQVTAFNWGYRTAPDPRFCRGLEDGVCNWPRGKALGGTSVINFMVYARGHRDDFDHWQRLGNPGWSYADVLPYFRKSEDVDIAALRASPSRGTGGYLSVQHAPFRTPLADAFLGAGRELGYNVTDPNDGATPLGFSIVQATMRRGRRCSASKAFLRPVRRRRNLHIAQRARVTRILIDPATRRATAVEFTKDRRRYTVRAAKEVILAAGAINSPHLLMLSGVGPRDHLEHHRIPVIQDLPVGYNLQDHISLSGLAFVVNDSVTVSERRVQNPAVVLDYIRNGRGPFTVPGGAEGIAFVRTKHAARQVRDVSDAPDYPDIELVMGNGALSGDASGSLRKLLGVPDHFYRQVYASIHDRDAFGIVPILMRPRSRGRVMLKSSNPYHWPLMHANYFEDERDLQVLVEGVKMAVKVAQSASFRRYDARLHTAPFLGCESVAFGSDAYWACAVRQVSTTLSHQSGTCKMGPAADPAAVVDAQLRVHGVAGLRVVDASVMPTLIAGHPNAAVFMIGEKAADMIKHTWLNNAL